LTLAEKFLTAKAAPYPDFIRELVAAGGLVEYARRFLSGIDGENTRRKR
jgi:hypothetical protein